MSDFKFENVIIAYTAGELLDQIKDLADETVIMPEGGVWAGVNSFVKKTETFTDAFDHTDYDHKIYEPASEDGEICFMLHRQETAPAGYRAVAVAGDLKQYLKEEVAPEYTAVSVDDNFELEGAITEKVKLLVLRSEDKLLLELK